MGNICTPDYARDWPIRNTAAADEAGLIDILNSYTAQNEKLEKENQLMKELAAMKEMLAEKDALLKSKDDELEGTSARIAKLKLQSQMLENENQMIVDTHKASTVIEGTLNKFTKGGKGKPNKKLVQVTQPAGTRS